MLLCMTNGPLRMIIIERQKPHHRPGLVAVLWLFFFGVIQQSKIYHLPILHWIADHMKSANLRSHDTVKPG